MSSSPVSNLELAQHIAENLTGGVFFGTGWWGCMCLIVATLAATVRAGNKFWLRKTASMGGIHLLHALSVICIMIPTLIIPEYPNAVIVGASIIAVLASCVGAIFLDMYTWKKIEEKRPKK